MTPLRDNYVRDLIHDAIVDGGRYRPTSDSRKAARTVFDRLLAAGMLTDPEEIARKMDAASSDGFRQGFGGAS